jgi:predicted nucleic acid-binding protein
VRVVVADTGPLHYLVLIREIDLLPRLFDTLVVPAEVWAELLQSKAPAVVRTWAAHPPDWLTVSRTPADNDAVLQTLDDGERAVIILSKSLRPDLILMDDRAGVAAARIAGFVVMGTLGLLDRAAQRGLVDLGDAFAALKATNFHMRQELLDFLLTRDRERRAK